ncbi:hypothetical protein OAH12_02965 [Cyclobacteriaceae bacterium]|nr:hypothetical protein [Cyclobacteriaceae bacterium]
MTHEIGPQYSKDKKTDVTGFLAKARLHQSTYRAEVLGVPFARFGNYLTKADADKGLNFYEGFDILDLVKARFPEAPKGLMDNMLRSDHIAFNMFGAFVQNKNFGVEVLNEFLETKIKSIDNVSIAYTPSPASRYLNDDTSFDVFIEYTDQNDELSAIGVQLKYAENEVKLKKGPKEEADMVNPESIYNIATKGCELYKEQILPILKTDKFRQIWKTHLLGERIKYKDNDKYKRFTLLAMGPEGNSGYIETSKTYINMLVNNEDNFVAVSYESFFEQL